jgi:hypothetical protein
MGGSFRIRGYTRRFFDLLGKDGADLVINDLPVGDGPGRDPVPAEMPARVCVLYERALAGRLPEGPCGAGKKYAVRYLTLH